MNSKSERGLNVRINIHHDIMAQSERELKTKMRYLINVDGSEFSVPKQVPIFDTKK